MNLRGSAVIRPVCIGSELRRVVKRLGPSPHLDQPPTHRLPRSSLTKHTILFLAANPAGTNWLALGREARAIQEELDRSSQGHKFELVTRWAVQPKDLLNELRRLKPTVVHFSGHGRRHVPGAADEGVTDAENTSGLLFEGADNLPQFVSAAVLQEMFGAAGAAVRLVMLNANHSTVQAKALLVHADCAIGMAASIHNDSARSFASGFYRGLGDGESVAAAYRLGCAAIGVDGLPDGDTPRLMVRQGTDTEQLVLVDQPAGCAPPPKSALTRHTILFLAANPADTDRLAQDHEARAIQMKLDQRKTAHRFEFETRWAVQPGDMLDEIRRLHPTVVHFSGHGGRHDPGSADGNVADDKDTVGLFFERPDGGRQFISAAALREMFGAAGAAVRLVVLNAGYSEVQAEMLLVHVDCAVAFRGLSRDDAARCFMIGFYSALAEGRSVAESYRLSCAALSLQGWRDGDQPRLMVRKGVDAERLVLSADFDNQPTTAIQLRDVLLKEDLDIPESGQGRNLIAVIGIDRYRDTRHWRALSNAVSDARGAAAIFAQIGFAQITEALIDDTATGRALQSIVTDELSVLRPDDSLVLFYAGHGGNRKHHVAGREVTTGYLIPVDADDKASTWVELEGWLRAVALLPAKHILVILDACHSGIALDPVIKWRDSTSWRNESLATLKARYSRRIITSALGDQRATDGGPSSIHSLFTGCLIEALTGGLRRKDELATTGSELGLYLQQRVGAYPHSRQTPDFGTFAFDDRGEMVIPFSIYHEFAEAENQVDAADRRSTTSAATAAIESRRGARSSSSKHDVFMESVTTEIAELLGVSVQMGERDARRVRFVVPGKRRMLRLRVRVITKGNRRVEVCLVSTGSLPRGSEPEPSDLSLEAWEYKSQILTGFRIPFQTLDYVMIHPLVSSALRYLTRYAAQLT